MLTVLSILFTGIAAGYLLRRIRLVSCSGRGIFPVVSLLLLLLGIRIGSDEQLIAGLGELGLQALAVALAATAGSVLAAAVLWKFYLKKRWEDKL